MKKTVRFKIDPYQDRASLVTCFAMNGYKSWVEKEDVFPHGYEFYVCVEMPPQEKPRGR